MNLVTTHSEAVEIGSKFGRLTITGFKKNIEARRLYVVCDCDCGTKDKATRWDGVS